MCGRLPQSMKHSGGGPPPRIIIQRRGSKKKVASDTTGLASEGCSVIPVDPDRSPECMDAAARAPLFVARARVRLPRLGKNRVRQTRLAGPWMTEQSDDISKRSVHEDRVGGRHHAQVGYHLNDGRRQASGMPSMPPSAMRSDTNLKHACTMPWPPTEMETATQPHRNAKTRRGTETQRQ